MTSDYVLRPKAVQDLSDHAYYLTTEASAALGHRFLLAADETFRNLAIHPLMGWRFQSQAESLKQLRVFRVAGFQRILVIYRPLESGVEIVRLIHGARDVLAILSE